MGGVLPLAGCITGAGRWTRGRKAPGHRAWRGVKLEKGRICFAPVREAAPLLQKEDPYVKIAQDTVEITCQTEMPLCYRGRIEQVEILRDTKSIEVFINGGEKNFSVWFAR